MKLQFAFGNPRRKKGIAKRRKKRKNSSVKSKLKKAVEMAKRKHRRPKSRFKKSHKRHVRKRNPEYYIARNKENKIIGRGRKVLDKRQEDAAKGKLIQLMAKYKSLPLGNERAAVMREMASLKSKLNLKAAELKTMQRYAESGANVKTYNVAEKGEGMAKRKRKGKGKSKRKGGKKKRSAAQKRALKKMLAAARKARKGKGKGKSKRKHKGGKRRSAAQKRALRKMLAAAKKARKGKKSHRRKHSKRHHSRKKKHHYPRMVSHRHSASTRHIKKGSTFRFKTVARKGKRKITVSGRVKFNPHRRKNPMTDKIQKALGLNMKEIQLLAVGAAAAPLSAAIAPKIPGLSQVFGVISPYIPVKYQSSVFNVLLGAGANMLADQKFIPASAKKPLAMVGEGLAAAAIIQLVSSVVTDGLKMANMAGLGIMPQLNGINYTPMRGINYTPSMRGINYTPSMRGGMGIMPQLNGMGSVDFGTANYGGGGGSKEARTQPSDFGAGQSMDSENDWSQGEDDGQSASMN